MESPVWCIKCRRVWEATGLRGEWPNLLCADEVCGADGPGTFMPYHQTRRLIARHWPASPTPGLTLNIGIDAGPDPTAESQA